MSLFLAGAMGFRARRDAAGRAPGYCSAWSDAPGQRFEREHGGFRLDQLPQGECRQLVLRRGEEGKGAGHCFELENGELRLEELPHGQRRETVLRVWGGRGSCSERGKGEFGLEDLPQGERRETVLHGGEREAAGNGPEREKREFGLTQLPQGEHRETALRGDATKGEVAGNCSEREQWRGARRLAAGRAPGDGSAWGKGGGGGMTLI